jgi:hypothetical protein
MGATLYCVTSQIIIIVMPKILGGWFSYGTPADEKMQTMRDNNDYTKGRCGCQSIQKFFELNQTSEFRHSETLDAWRWRQLRDDGRSSCEPVSTSVRTSVDQPIGAVITAHTGLSYQPA